MVTLYRLEQIFSPGNRKVKITRNENKASERIIKALLQTELYVYIITFHENLTRN